MPKRTIAAISVALTALNVAAQKPLHAPTPPPMEVAEKSKAVEAAVVAQSAGAFSIGDPTDEEQLYLELMNRARADANAEAERLIALAATNPDVFEQFVTAWHVDVALMRAQFATNPPVPPLSMNAKLTAAARAHSQFQFDTATQTHTGSGGSSPGGRATAAGYVWGRIGENVFLNATSPEHGHAGFNIDWGPGVGGMQSPPGHRDTIHSGNFTEVGIGVVNGRKTVNGNESGPQVVTQDFGRPQSAVTYITGVVYYDINGNNFYDLGEGLPGVQVNVDGVAAFAITAKSGGYSVPVPPNRSHTVRFNANGYAQFAQTVNVAASNVKVDFKPAYVVPTASGPATAFVGSDTVYNIAPLPGATGYRARVTELVPFFEGAEGSLDHLSFDTFGGYSVTSSSVRASGAKSFHLAHFVNNGFLVPQTMEFDGTFNVIAGGRIEFKSRLGISGGAQVANMQVSNDNGSSWTTLWSQAGGSEETSFSTKSVALENFVGQSIKVRFLFDFLGGSAFPQPNPGEDLYDRAGWYIDDVSIVNAPSGNAATLSPVLTGPQFAFRPTTTGTYLIQFQAITGARELAFGPAQTVNVQDAPPSVTFLKQVALTPTTVTLQFDASATPSSIVVVSSSSVAGPYSPVAGPGVTLSGPDQGRYTLTTPRSGDMRFYMAIVGAE